MTFLQGHLNSGLGCGRGQSKDGSSWWVDGGRKRRVWVLWLPICGKDTHNALQQHRRSWLSMHFCKPCFWRSGDSIFIYLPPEPVRGESVFLTAQAAAPFYHPPVRVRQAERADVDDSNGICRMGDLMYQESREGQGAAPEPAKVLYSMGPILPLRGGGACGPWMSRPCTVAPQVCGSGKLGASSRWRDGHSHHSLHPCMGNDH